MPDLLFEFWLYDFPFCFQDYDHKLKDCRLDFLFFHTTNFFGLRKSTAINIISTNRAILHRHPIDDETLENNKLGLGREEEYGGIIWSRQLKLVIYNLHGLSWHSRGILD